jgi:hypothetical protein
MVVSLVVHGSCKQKKNTQKLGHFTGENSSKQLFAAAATILLCSNKVLPLMGPF